MSETNIYDVLIKLQESILECPKDDFHKRGVLKDIYLESLKEVEKLKEKEV